jgi:hypothetical protein
MAFSGSHGVATPPNPSSSQTDFSFIVDLSNLPHDWWDLVDTTDGTKGRASKADGTTELPTDWIDFDSTAQTGLVRVKYTGSKSSTVDEPVWIYPPKAANPSYGVSDTYGQYNAYDTSYAGYYPLGGGTDRTSNQNNLTGYGSPVEGDSTGPVGSSTEYNGTTQYFEADVSEVTSAPLTMIAWANVDALRVYTTAIQLSNKSVQGDYFALSEHNSSNGVWYWTRTAASSSGGRVLSTDQITANTWYMWSGVENNSSSRSFKINDGIATTNSADLSPSGVDRTSIGRSGDSTPSSYFNGKLAQISVHSVARDENWISYEYAQTADNSTFWGTWTVEGGGDTVSVTGSDSVTLSDTSASLVSLSLSCSDLFSLSESLETGLSILLSASDGVNFAETGTPNILILASGSDSFGFGDNSSTGGIIPLTGSDGFNLSDSSTVVIGVSVISSDGLGIGDNGTTGGIIPTSGIDILSLSDSASITISVTATGSDTVSLNDVIDLVHSLSLYGSDDFDISDYARQAGVIDGILRMALSVIVPHSSVIGKKAYIEIKEYKGYTDIIKIDQN